MTREEQAMFQEMQETNSFLRASFSIQAEQIQALSQQLSIALEQNQQQAERIEELLQRIDELTGKGKNSQNSSKPPSSDGYGKKPAPKSLKKPSGKKQGGQSGHKGSSLKITREPDEVVPHYPVVCQGCPNRGKCVHHICESRPTGI